MKQLCPSVFVGWVKGRNPTYDQQNPVNSEKPRVLLLLPTRTYRATADAATATGLQHEPVHTELHYNEQGTHLIEIDALLPQ